jgi:hypothetical protein
MNIARERLSEGRERGGEVLPRQPSASLLVVARKLLLLLAQDFKLDANLSHCHLDKTALPLNISQGRKFDDELIDARTHDAEATSCGQRFI